MLDGAMAIRFNKISFFTQTLLQVFGLVLIAVYPPGSFQDLDEIRNCVVNSYQGRLIYLRDLAEVEFDYEAYDRGSKVVGDNLAMVNLYQHMGWDSLKNDIRAAAASGCTAIFVDPITNLTAGMESGAANVKLQEIATELSALAMDLQVIVFIF